MPYSPMPVKILTARALAAVPMRTLRTLAHYTNHKRTSSQTRASLAADLLRHWTTPAYRRLVRQSLTAADYALLHALWAGEHPLPDTDRPKPKIDSAGEPCIRPRGILSGVFLSEGDHGVKRRFPRFSIANICADISVAYDSSVIQ